MGFLAPAFLAGLIALAVPVLIHLTHRERREVVVFPSLMFIRKIPFKSVRKQRLRHLLLFAMRCLALLLLVIAFARPLIGRRADAAAAANRGTRELVILIDQSYSMGRQDDEVQMTFDTSFDDSRPTTTPPKNETPSRPEMKTSKTLPEMTLRDPWNDPDDEDFGKEKEMTMTFA